MRWVALWLKGDATGSAIGRARVLLDLAEAISFPTGITTRSVAAPYKMLIERKAEKLNKLNC